MAVFLSPVGGVAAQFFTNTGAVLTGGKIYTYAAGTTTPATTYTSSQGTTPWTNPIVLDAAGRVSGSGEIWLTDGINYKFVLKDSNDVLIATYDNISGINSNFVAYTNSQEIQTATSGQTVFTLTTMQYQVGTNSLSVFVDGVNQYGPGASYAYTETSSTSVTFVSGLHVGAEVKFTSTQQQGAGAVDSSQVTYDPPFTGSVATNVEAKLAQYISVEDFGAVGDGVTDDTAAIQAAIDYAASLTGAAHDGTQSFFEPFGNARAIQLSPVKYAISQTLTIKNSVSIFGNGGGFLALAGFGAGDYMVDMDGDWQSGTVQDLTLDGNDKNVKGLEINNAAGCVWSNITVLNCRNDGITYTFGADFVLNNFFVSCSTTPASNSVAGLLILASDGVFNNGVCRFNPIGVYLNGGGNNEFVNVHCWGGYTSVKQYINFYLKGSYRNTFTSCYGDSPTKQNYSLDNWTTVSGIPNGGVCWYLAAGTGTDGSQENKLTNCRGFVNFDAYTSAGLAAKQLLYWYLEAYCFQNAVVSFADVGGTPAGKTQAFADNPWEAVTPTIRDANVIFTSSTPTLPFLRISKAAASGDRRVLFTLNNTDNSSNISGTAVQFNLVDVEQGSVRVVKGSGGYFPEMYLAAGTGQVNLFSNGQFVPNTDNTQALGGASNRWSVVYAGTGTINTSDEREKQDVAEIDDAEKRVAVALKGLFKKFRFKDAVQVKGDGARIHFGVIAQDVMSAFQAEGLDPMRYGVVCFDEWEAKEAVMDETGAEIVPAQLAGNRYGVRYEELLCFLMAAQ
jgi:hypothetical protein